MNCIVVRLIIKQIVFLN